MNNEIKLMLNIIKDVSEHKEGSRNGLMILSCKDYKVLLDYITNLQQRCEYLERSNNRREDTILGLRQEIDDVQQERDNLISENQRLKEAVDREVQENERLKEERQRLLYNLEKVCLEKACVEDNE